MKKKDNQSNEQLLYSEEEREHISNLQLKMQTARNARNLAYPEFGNKTLLQKHDEEEKIANTVHLREKKNDDDVVLSTGTIESRLRAVISNVNDLNLQPEVMAIDKNNTRLTELADSINDIVRTTEITDGADGVGDQEKQIERQVELLKHGVVFCRESWVTRYAKEKKLKGQQFDGNVEKFEGYSEEFKIEYQGPSRQILSEMEVYLGNLTKFYIEEQPFLFTVKYASYDVAKTMYQNFSRWKFVHKGNYSSTLNQDQMSIFDNKFRLTDIQRDQVEIIEYQSQVDNEYQLIINGVLMMPVGFPLSEITPGGKYNITKQVLYIINSNFAYGKSFVSSGDIKEISKLIDQMYEMSVIKFRKSIHPPYVNNSGRAIDRKVLAPGRISMGIEASALQPIGQEGQGMTAGDVQIMRDLQSLVVGSTVSNQFVGQSSGGRQTAYEIMELQKQARKALGVLITACTLLEVKIAYLRLWNILANWFQPTGTELDEARNQIVNVYRKTNTETRIQGEGLGQRDVVPQDGDLPTPEEIRKMERVAEAQRGVPVRKIFISPKKLQDAKLIWFITVNAQERDSTPFAKLLFREQLNDIVSMVKLGSVPNMEWLEEEFARTWKISKNKPFVKKSQQQQMLSQMQKAQGVEGGAQTPEQVGQSMGQSSGSGMMNAMTG